MKLRRLLLLTAFYCLICRTEACVIPIQENEKITESNSLHAGGYKIFK